MEEEFCRSEMLLGSDGMDRLKKAKVAVFGIGGVGSYCVEALARAGVGSLVLIDGDRVSLSNINRQLIALHSTVGMLKTCVAANRIADINPRCRVTQYPVFFLPENEGGIDLSGCSYIVDAVDTVTAKLAVIKLATNLQVPVISCMGAGNKLDPAQLEIADIFNTSVCPLARVMRRELRKLGINRCRVVYSKEPPAKTFETGQNDGGKPSRPVPGSVSFVPAAAGLMMAGQVVRDLSGV